MKSNTHNPYKSCNCAICRHWPPSKIRGEHKTRAHRMFRHQTRIAIQCQDYERIPHVVSTGHVS